MTPSANIDQGLTTCHKRWLIISYNLHDIPKCWFWHNSHFIGGETASEREGMPDLPSVGARSLDLIASAVGNRLHQVSWGSGEFPSQCSLKACFSPWYLLPPLLRLSSLSPRAVFLSPTEGNKLL